MENSEKRDSGSKSSSPRKQLQKNKVDVCNEVLKRLRAAGNELVINPGFVDEIHAHFQRLPARYAADVNVERTEDVLMHKRLLEEATTSKNCPVHVRPVHVFPVPVETIVTSQSPTQDDLVGSLGAHRPSSIHLPPAFGSTANLEALALEMMKPSQMEDEKDSSGSNSVSKFSHQPMHEVTLSTSDKPKLLSELSSLLAEVGLNIREAHVFSTVDGFSLDVFVVDGWPTEEVEELQQALETALAGPWKRIWSKDSPSASPAEPAPEEKPPVVEFLKIPSDGTDDWEIDLNHLKYDKKIASGSFGDLYRGTYCGQDVAIKVLKPERLNDNLQREFAQEVFIMRKVRHKNVVQFIGACTRPPKLCIVTEFMAGGSVYDHLHKHKSMFKMPTLLKVAIDVSRGMDYLHQCNIIHRDLKAANLLMDEHEVIKVADFGVARVQAQGGVMTAETGTYRWMAPEVIEHRPYDRKADVFSFGIVLWELLTGKLPYEQLTPLQAAVGVVQKGLRPTIPKNIHPRLAELLTRCWQHDPTERPEFSEITPILQDILKEVNEDEKKEKKGFFSSLKKNNF
ncbi:hypothetical protein KP509_09G060400 [Ceratopteris richardii]|uniref:non-specific serine/threonine protein kinase n=1 Tax=Ceratopteris richardii TaxID=49495 RepID=A0A8T2U1P5_CERRI|nr:hypothetical protein KP509_09G060400 [Ceratopteris richardii]